VQKNGKESKAECKSEVVNININSVKLG